MPDPLFLSRSDLNTFNSWSNVIDVCNVHMTVLALHPKLSGYFTEVKSNYDSILMKAVKRNDLNKGIADAIKAAKAEIVHPIFAYSCILRDYGSDSNKPEILAKCNVSESAIERFAPIRIYEYGMENHGLLTENILELTDYLVTAEEVQAFKDLLDIFKGKITKVKSKEAEAQAMTKQLQDLFKNTRALLRKMDLYMERLKVSNKDFYLVYKEARKIIDLPATRQTPTPADPENPPA